MLIISGATQRFFKRLKRVADYYADNQRPIRTDSEDDEEFATPTGKTKTPFAKSPEFMSNGRVVKLRVSKFDSRNCQLDSRNVSKR